MIAAMSLKLNANERYIIAYYRSDHVASAWWALLVVRCLLGGLFAYGMYSADQAVLFTAFGTLILLDLYSQARQPTNIRSIRSALEKLEQRIEALENPMSTD